MFHLQAQQLPISEKGVRSCNHTFCFDLLPIVLPRRIAFFGAVLYDTSRDNARQFIVADDQDRAACLTLLAYVIDRYD